MSAPNFLEDPAGQLVTDLIIFEGMLVDRVRKMCDAVAKADDTMLVSLLPGLKNALAGQGFTDDRLILNLLEDFVCHVTGTPLTETQLYLRRSRAESSSTE